MYWGTYDPDRPRNRIIASGLRTNGVELFECNSNVFEGVRDKSQLVGTAAGLRILVRWLASYPDLIRRYLRTPPHDFVIVGYLGHLDVVVIWPFAKLRRAKVVWDVYISLYDTLVDDREMFPAWSPAAWLIWTWEWLATHAADLVVLDTRTNATHFVGQFGSRSTKSVGVLIGAEMEGFEELRSKPGERRSQAETQVLYFGQMIPLHGLDTVLAAAKLAADKPIRWTFVGKGQDELMLVEQLRSGSSPKLEWLGWVPHAQLIDQISQADICLGIFGTSEKAERVIPNKVFETILAGKPLITRDSPAIREFIFEDNPGIRLIPPGDPQALVSAVEYLSAELDRLRQMDLHRRLIDRVAPGKLAAEVLRAMRAL